MKVWARGGLGNQILEYFFGISYAIKKNKTFSLHFSTKPPKKSDLVFHNQSLPLIQNLFYLDRKINLSEKKINKTIYWDPKLIDCFFSIDKSLIDNFIKPNFSNKKIIQKYSVLHIRGTDKTLRDTEELYEPLIEEAKQSQFPVRIVTDDNKLSKYLSKKHGLYFNDKQSSVFEDWLTLYYADEIFSIYSTFSYSTLLFKPNKRYVIPSFENAYRFYKHANKEYLALSQFLPYCRNLEILGYKRGNRKNFYFDNQICNILQIKDIFTKNNSLSSNEKDQILTTLESINLGNINKSLLKLYKIICNPLVFYNGLYGFNNKIINSIKKYIFFKNINNLSLKEIPNFFLLRDLLILKFFFRDYQKRESIAILKGKLKKKNISDNLKSSIDNFDCKLQEDGIFIYEDIDKYNLNFFRFLAKSNINSNNKENFFLKLFKINLLLNLINKKRIYSYISASLGIKYFDFIFKLLFKNYKLFPFGDCHENQKNTLFFSDLKGYKIIFIPNQKDFNKSKIKYITNSHKLSFDRLIFGNQLALQSNLGSSFICKNNEYGMFGNNKKITNKYSSVELNIEENNLIIINDLLLFQVDENFLRNNYYLISL